MFYILYSFKVFHCFIVSVLIVYSLSCYDPEVTKAESNMILSCFKNLIVDCM